MHGQCGGEFRRRGYLRRQCARDPRRHGQDERVLGREVYAIVLEFERDHSIAIEFEFAKIALEPDHDFAPSQMLQRGHDEGAGEIADRKHHPRPASAAAEGFAEQRARETSRGSARLDIEAGLREGTPNPLRGRPLGRREISDDGGRGGAQRLRFLRTPPQAASVARLGAGER